MYVKLASPSASSRRKGRETTDNLLMETSTKGRFTTGLFRGTFLLGFPLRDALNKASVSTLGRE